MTNNPLVSIVVLNYNGEKLLARFLPYVTGINYNNKEIILVDNASCDGSAELVGNEFPCVRLILNHDNSGTAEGGNIGARQAKGKYIFFISNDMELASDMLDLMVRRMESDVRIGICTSKMRRITEDGTKINIIDSVGGDLDIFGFPSARGINQPDRGQYDDFREVFFSFGGALLIQKRIFWQAGGYDPLFFTLADDIDLCWRVRLLGYKVVVEPHAVLYHRVSATLGLKFNRAQKRFMSEKNTLRMLLKNYGAAFILCVLPVYLAIFLSEVILFIILGRISLVNSLFSAFWWNIFWFKDTLRLRKEVQLKRKVTDLRILRRIGKKSYKAAIFYDFLFNFRREDWQRFFD